MTPERSKRFDQLIDKVAALGSTAKLSDSEKAEYEELCNDWNDRDRVMNHRENYGF